MSLALHESRLAASAVQEEYSQGVQGELEGSCQETWQQQQELLLISGKSVMRVSHFHGL